MTCRACRSHLAAHAAAQLAVRPARRVARHLAACAACRDELAALQRTLLLLRQAPPHRPPADLWQRVAAEFDSAAARSPARRPRRPRRRLAWAGGAAAVVLVVLAALLRPVPPGTALADAAAFVPLHQRLAGSEAWGAPALGDLLAAVAEGRP